jgi:hypothetical protein
LIVEIEKRQKELDQVMDQILSDILKKWLWQIRIWKLKRLGSTGLG